MNIFMENRKLPSLEDYMKGDENGRGNLGSEIPVSVYRLMEYSLKEELRESLGAEKQIQIFRAAGRRAGEYFARNMLDLSLPVPAFLSHLQNQIKTLKIGVLRIEHMDVQTGKIVLTVSEDADCSGLPVLGETVCNYDEGFLSGILSAYTGKYYVAVETDCWATGDRVCRFCAETGED